MRLILASASPRRKALLKVLGLEFDIIVSDCDEIIDYSLSADNIVKSLSLQKASNISKKAGNDAIVIGADTVVEYDNNILGKPKDYNDAVRMLKMLSGNTHHVYTGFTIIRTSDGKTVCDYDVSSVTFKKLTDEEIENYVKTNNPADKAGAYSIQGAASSFVDDLNGDYNNVVGLPIFKLSKYLYNTYDL